MSNTCCSIGRLQSVLFYLMTVVRVFMPLCWMLLCWMLRHRQKHFCPQCFLNNSKLLQFDRKKKTIHRLSVKLVYDNEYTSIINIYFYEFCLPLKPWAIMLQNIWDTLSNILHKRLRFSLIKIEPVSIKPKPSLL